MPKVYALFVGINQYVAVTPLHGCVEDITAVEALFRERVPAEALDLLILRDAEATRERIIDGLRSHLSRAGSDDFALFYYCGHGSQEECPPEWRALEPSGLNQTLVPVDARTGDVFDLADKELSVLLHAVAAGGARVVTIFDSCHSGGVTRGADDDLKLGVPRMTAARRDRTRTLDDYLELARTLYDPARVAEYGPPEPRHIAIAACQHNETAKEFPLVPPRRGAFSASFEEALRSLGPTATYVDLVNAIRMKVRDRATDQVPNLFVSGDALATEVFLAGQAGRRDLTVDADAAGQWWLSSGAIDGLPAPTDGGVTEVDIFRRGAFDEAAVSKAMIAPVAHGVVDFVDIDRSRLRITAGSESLDSSLQFIATITKLGSPAALHVVVVDEGASPQSAEQAAAVRAALSARALHFAVVEKSGGAPTITVQVQADTSRVIGVDGIAIDGLVFPNSSAGLEGLVAACRHLALWYGTRDRAFIGSPLNDRVRIELVPVAERETSVPGDRPSCAADATGMVVLSYTGESPPRVQFRLRNTANERLYVALLDLTNTFECAPMFADWIPAGGTGYVKGGKGLKMTVPPWPDANARVAADDLKLFAAIADFDVGRFELPALVGPDKGSGTRKVVDDEDEPSASWGTTLVHVEIRR